MDLVASATKQQGSGASLFQARPTRLAQTKERQTWT